MPAWKIDTREGEIKYWTLAYLNILFDSITITAVALGTATRIAGETAGSRAIVAALASRWPAAFLASLVAAAAFSMLAPISGFGPPLDPPVLAVITVPVCWIFYGAISLAPPIAALSPERPLLAALHGVGRALTLSFHRANIARLAIVTFASVLPLLVEAILGDPRFHVPRLFWVNIPVDALTVGPLAALQTVFALDFARRAGVLSAPRE